MVGLVVVDLVVVDLMVGDILQLYRGTDGLVLNKGRPEDSHDPESDRVNLGAPR